MARLTLDGQPTRQPTQSSEIVHRIFDAADHLELAAAFYDAQSLAPVELRRAMRALARRDGAASIDERTRAAQLRLRAWLALDVEEARVIARAFDDAFLDLPESWRERSREIEFSVIINGLHAREFRQLTRILPWLRDSEGTSWLLDHLPDEDPADALSDATGQPQLAVAAP